MVYQELCRAPGKECPEWEDLWLHWERWSQRRRETWPPNGCRTTLWWRGPVLGEPPFLHDLAFTRPAVITTCVPYILPLRTFLFSLSCFCSLPLHQNLPFHVLLPHGFIIVLTVPAIISDSQHLVLSWIHFIISKLHVFVSIPPHPPPNSELVTGMIEISFIFKSQVPGSVSGTQ